MPFWILPQFDRQGTQIALYAFPSEEAALSRKEAYSLWKCGDPQRVEELPENVILVGFQAKALKRN